MPSFFGSGVPEYPAPLIMRSSAAGLVADLATVARAMDVADLDRYARLPFGERPRERSDQDSKGGLADARLHGIVATRQDLDVQRDEGPIVAAVADDERVVAYDPALDVSESELPRRHQG